MIKTLFNFKVTDIEELIDLVHAEASKYCAYSLIRRQELAVSANIYVSIELWDGRSLTATSISSCVGHDLDEIEDIVLMDGVDIKTTIESRLRCLVEEICNQFVTFNDYGDSTDILLWEIIKSS